RRITKSRPGSDFQADGAHQFQGVAFLNNAGAEPVVEDKLAVFDMILKMHIRATGCEGVRDVRKREIVRRNEPQGAASDKTLHNRLRTDSAIVRVGPV